MQPPKNSSSSPRLSLDYPRMMFHRTRDPVTVHSREEEDFLGFEWSRKIWPAEAPEPGPEPEPEKEISPDALPAEPPPIAFASKTAKKKH